MEPLIVLAERNVIFHGIWVAGFRVTDNLVKSIGLELDSKPSRSCKLLLTSAGVTLEILPSVDGKTGKTDQVPFQDLRDITINPYNTKCLMIVYVDAKSSHFSIMACSSQEERHLSAICGAFKDRKNFLLQTQQNRSSGQEPLNWTLRMKHRNSVDGHQALPNTGAVPYVNGTYVRANQANPPRIFNGFVPPAGVGANGGAAFSYRHFSDGSDNLEDDAFIEETTVVQVHHANEELDREPVDGSEAYNVGVQTLHSGDESDAESIKSDSSFRSLRDDIYTLSEEMKAIKFLLETSTGISAEEYYRRRDIQGNRHAMAFHTVPKVKFTGEQEGLNSETDKKDHHTNGAEFSANDNDNNNNVKDEEEDYDLRSIGAQTDKSKMNQRRYARKPMNVIIANANKEKVAAVRKKSSNSSVTSPGGPNSMGGGGSSSGGSGSFSDVPRSPLGVSQRSSVSSYSYQSSSVVPPGKVNSKPPKKSPAIIHPSSSSTVVKPIESVYQGRKPRRSNSASNYGASRKRIVFMAPPKAI